MRFSPHLPQHLQVFQNAKHRWGWGLKTGLVVGGVTVQSTGRPGREFFSKYEISNQQKKTKHLWNSERKIFAFLLGYIYIVVVSIHQQFFGGLDFQGRNQLEPTRKKLRSVRVTGIWRKFMAPVPLPVPSFKPPPGGWEEGIRQVVVSCVGNGGRARNMLGDDFWIP